VTGRGSDAGAVDGGRGDLGEAPPATFFAFSITGRCGVSGFVSRSGSRRKLLGGGVGSGLVGVGASRSSRRMTTTCAAIASRNERARRQSGWRDRFDADR
jgi:hypothetical protein